MVVVAVVIIKDGFNAEFDTIDVLWSVMTTIQTYTMNRCRRGTMNEVVVVVDNDDDDTIRNRGETQVAVISFYTSTSDSKFMYFCLTHKTNRRSNVIADGWTMNDDKCVHSHHTQSNAAMGSKMPQLSCVLQRHFFRSGSTS